MPKVSTAVERIDGWKEIAGYLGKDVTTAIRWEKLKGLPVHRMAGGKRQPVYAYRHEIDAWLEECDTLGPSDVAPSTGHSHPETRPDGHPQLNHRALGSANSDRWLTGMITVATIALASIVATLAFRSATPNLAVANPTRITQSQTHILSPLLTDGDRIFYPRYDNSRYSIAAVLAKGGVTTTVSTNLSNPELCDVARSNGMMLLRDLVHNRDDMEPLYVQSKGSVAQRVGNLLAYDASWYPDAQRIIYSANGDVYSTDIRGASPRLLFSVPGNAYWFRWAPDGRKLRFTVINKSNEDLSLWEVAKDGTDPHRLFPKMRYYQCCGSWTPDGKFFLFQTRVDSQFQIWAQRTHHSYVWPGRNQPFPLISGGMSYRGPLPGVDGKKLFVRAEAPKGELLRFDSKSGEFIPVLPSLSVRTLAYSSDKNWIAYTSLADNNLWRCRADGTQCLQLTRVFRQTVMPRWSPDGQMIAFMGIGFTGNWRVLVVPANGGRVRPVSPDDQGYGNPEWLPDGHHLAYGGIPPASQPKGIYILDLRSGKSTLLPGSVGFDSPRWSPDGHSVVALHAGDEHLYLFDLGSGRWRLLANIPACYPNWSQDGRFVYFRPFASSDRAIYRVALDDHRIEKVASLAGVERGPFFMGDWIGLAPDDSPLVVRNATVEDIYAWDLMDR